MFLDISIGMIIGIIAGFITDSSEKLSLIIFGGVCAVIPDFDFVIYLFRRNWIVDEFSHEHRDLFHEPILFSFGGGIFFLYFGFIWGAIWIIGTLYHFVRDTVDSGWGIRWGYPFYKGYFTLVPYSPKRIIPTKEEQRVLATKYGNPNWLKQGYLEVNQRLIIEIVFLVVAVLVSAWWIF